MLPQVLVQLEHGRLVLAAKHGPQLVVGEDFAPVLRVLKFVLLNVIPNLLDRLGSGQRLVTSVNEV